SIWTACGRRRRSSRPRSWTGAGCTVEGDAIGAKGRHCPMETRPMPEPEKTYHMYDAIVAQPEAFRAVAARNAVAAVRWAPAVVGARRLWLVGTGSSHHAARFGAYGLRHHMEHLDVQTVAAFDFSLYGPPLSPDDVVVVVSHRGAKLYSRQALE